MNSTVVMYVACMQWSLSSLRLRRWLRPTLELVGIYGGVKDGIKTIVPATATLKMVARLVPNQNPAKVLKVGCLKPSCAGSETSVHSSAYSWLSTTHLPIHCLTRAKDRKVNVCQD